MLRKKRVLRGDEAIKHSSHTTGGREGWREREKKGERDGEGENRERHQKGNSGFKNQKLRELEEQI